jgi:hypothetical protein
VLVSSTSHFKPGQIDDVVTKVTRYFIIAFVANCLLLLYCKKFNNAANNSIIKKLEKENVPIG